MSSEANVTMYTLEYRCTKSDNVIKYLLFQHGVSRGAYMKDDKAVVSVNEMAAMLGISRGLAYQAVRDGRIRSVKLGSRILVPASEVEAFLKVGGSQGTSQKV